VKPFNAFSWVPRVNFSDPEEGVFLVSMSTASESSKTPIAENVLEQHEPLLQNEEKHVAQCNTDDVSGLSKSVALYGAYVTFFTALWFVSGKDFFPLSFFLPP
jgi:hypothetical protein